MSASPKTTCPGNAPSAPVSGGLPENLAARLRQAIQGCVVHIHGPVQAWAEIEDARAGGLVSGAEVARIARAACEQRIRDLKEGGAAPNDARVRKEELTSAFIARLLGAE